jgi:hypothetical protein
LFDFSSHTSLWHHCLCYTYFRLHLHFTIIVERFSLENAHTARFIIFPIFAKWFKHCVQFVFLFWQSFELSCETVNFFQGLIQSVFELQDGSGVVITVGKYVTPKHKDINGNGIEPDFQKLPGIYSCVFHLFFLSRLVSARKGWSCYLVAWARLLWGTWHIHDIDTNTPYIDSGNNLRKLKRLNVIMCMCRTSNMSSIWNVSDIYLDYPFLFHSQIVILFSIFMIWAVPIFAAWDDVSQHLSKCSMLQQG